MPSMRKGAFGSPALSASLTAAAWFGIVTPPQVRGSAASSEPSRSRCGIGVPTAVGFTPGMPSAPGNRP